MILFKILLAVAFATVICGIIYMLDDAMKEGK